MKDVFISYKAEEFDEANWVKSTLETNGISCWMAPSCIPGGSSYAVEIPQAIREAKVFVLILSDKAQESKWVSREVDLAINEGKIVLPFMLENCKLKDDFNFYLTNVQRYAAFENKMAAMEKMINEIKALIGCKSETNLLEPTPNVEIKSATLPTQKNHLCITSMILGIVSILFLGIFLIPNIIAIITAIIGVSKNNGASARNKKFAIAGLTLGSVSNLIGLCVWFSFIGFLISLVVAAISLYLFIKKSNSN